MLDKLEGRRRGYTPPRWWRQLFEGDPRVLYHMMGQVEAEFGNVEYLGARGKLLPIQSAQKN
jgi:hypothetical protein